MINIQFEIRKCDTTRIGAIKERLSEWVSDDFSYHYFLRGMNIHNNICTFEAYDQLSQAGIITAWKSEMHPFCTYFSMITNPHSGFNVESALFKALNKFRENEFPLQTSIWESSYRLKIFYEEAGFTEIRRTYMPSLKTVKIDVQEVFPEIIGQSITIKDFNSITNNKEHKYELINLVKETYKKVHTANPVGDHSLQKWEQLIFNEDTILDGSYILLKDNEIQAFTLLHYSDSPNKFEFGWRGTKGNSDIKFMLLLTAYQINFAEKNGVDYIDGEVDTTDYYSLEMLNFFPFSPAPALITFQKLN